MPKKITPDGKVNLVITCLLTLVYLVLMILIIGADSPNATGPVVVGLMASVVYGLLVAYVWVANCGDTLIDLYDDYTEEKD